MSQKVAYVTGGMGGIGTAICQRLHKEGFTVIAGCGIGVFPSRTRSGGRPREPHEQRAAGIVLQIAHHPVRAFPLAGGKVVTADAFGVLREITQDVFGFQ